MLFRKNNRDFVRQKKIPRQKSKFWSKVETDSLSLLAFIRPLIILFFVVLGYILYSNVPTWLEKLDNSPIRVYGLTYKPKFTTNEDIRSALSTAPELKGYFGQDIKEVEDKLTAIPWVRSVVARKIWPDRLSLTLLEHKPVAVWNDSKLLSARGEVFSLPFDRIDRTKLPVLYGPDSAGKKVLTAWSKIKKDLVSRNLVLKSVAIDNRGSWKITLENGIELKLGKGDWLPKIDRFVKIYPQIEVPEGKVVSYVDLRYQYGASVGFRDLKPKTK